MRSTDNIGKKFTGTTAEAKPHSEAAKIIIHRILGNLPKARRKTAPENKKNEWYQAPLKGGAMWIEPYFGQASDTNLVEFGVPFYESFAAERAGKPPIGVVSGNISQEAMRKLVGAQQIAKHGYGLVVSKKRRFVVHPREEVVRQKDDICS